MNKVRSILLTIFLSLSSLLAGGSSIEEKNRESRKSSFITYGLLGVAATAGIYAGYKMYHAFSKDKKNKKEDDDQKKEEAQAKNKSPHYKHPFIEYDAQGNHIIVSVNPHTLEINRTLIDKPMVFHSLQTEGEGSLFSDIDPDVYNLRAKDSPYNQDCINVGALQKAFLSKDPDLRHIIIGVVDWKVGTPVFSYEQNERRESIARPKAYSIYGSFQEFETHCENNNSAVLILIPKHMAPPATVGI